ncbi:gluconate permease [Planctomycetales bacterium ZRK34]|nr:gluconate permease [Planctomycetales bacterium ZRK34]
MEQSYPLLILLVGMVIVIGGIVALRINAFVALITAAIVVSLMAPGEWAMKIQRVAAAFGSTAASIGIVIALAAIIGKAMTDSGAADRVVRMFLSMLGEKRAGAVLTGSGFTLSIPVFFDTAFYLLIPLARSMQRRTGRHYLKYLMAIVAGAGAAHNLVPPTPGPLFLANSFGVDVGLMIVMGLTVGVPAAGVGLLYARWLDARYPVVMKPLDEHEPEPLPDERLPSLTLSLAPILLPIALITTNSIVRTLAAAQIPDAPLRDPQLTEAITAAAAQGLMLGRVFAWTNILGNPNFALLISAALAVWTLQIQRKPTRKQMAESIESALAAGGVIILITAAGGAFGAMLKAAGLGEAVQQTFGDTATSGLGLLFFAFGMASLIKIAQGSSTAATIVASGMIAAMIGPDSLTCHPVYLALAIGSGSLVGSWMNDSGFWIFTKMGGINEVQALRSWSVLLALIGIVAMAGTVTLAIVLPMGPT